MSKSLFVRNLSRVIPICFIVGASIEFFMCKTGFYNIVTAKEAERRADREIEEEARRQRLLKLGITPVDLSNKSNNCIDKDSSDKSF